MEIEYGRHTFRIDESSDRRLLGLYLSLHEPLGQRKWTLEEKNIGEKNCEIYALSYLDRINAGIKLRRK